MHEPRTDEVFDEAIPIYDRMSPNFINPGNPVKLTGFVQTEPDTLTRLGGWLFRVVADAIGKSFGFSRPKPAPVAGGKGKK